MPATIDRKLGALLLTRTMERRHQRGCRQTSSATARLLADVIELLQSLMIKPEVRNERFAGSPIPLRADAARDELITRDLIRAVQQGRSPLVLTGRAERLARFETKLSSSEQRVILAAWSYIGEGFDDVRLDMLFLATPISWKGTLRQFQTCSCRLECTSAACVVTLTWDIGSPADCQSSPG